MALELGGRIFLQFPLRYAAYAADPLKPLVPEPADGPAVPGIIDDECFIAMGGDFGLISDRADGFNAMQYAFSGRPQFDFINQTK